MPSRRLSPGGATPEQVGAAVAHAAFLRMARFHLSNEFRGLGHGAQHSNRRQRAAPGPAPLPDAGTPAGRVRRSP